MLRLSTQQSGFTLVEALVVTGIIAIIFAIGVINLGQPQTSSRSISATDILVSDLKNQQTAAMAGAVGSSTTQQPAGVYVQPSQYTLFNGATYAAGNSFNYVYTPATGVTFSTTFPSGIVLFNKGTGEVNGFAAGSNTITINSGATTKVVTLSRFGAITVN